MPLHQRCPPGTSGSGYQPAGTVGLEGAVMAPSVGHAPDATVSAQRNAPVRRGLSCAILGSNQRGREAFDREVTVRSRTGEMLPIFEYSTRYWDRTSYLFRVREARYRCANRAYVRLFSLPSEVATGFEPVWTALQAAASPLGHATRCAVTALG